MRLSFINKRERLITSPVTVPFIKIFIYNNLTNYSKLSQGFYMFFYFYLFIKYLLYFCILSFQKQKFYNLKYLKQNEKFIPYTLNNRKKPNWVKQKIIYLKALLPNYGCRKIATIFNKHYYDKNISVSKSYVYYIIRENQYKIVQKRRYIKNKRPKDLPKNFLWQIDLTNITDCSKNRNQVFGIIDSGSRAIIYLQRLKNKSTITILKAIFYSIEQYGKPKIIKSDNEIVFKSKLFRFSLWCLKIKHETTQIATPWQNGRIERFFNTLKYTTKQIEFYNKDKIDKFLKIFRFYYNHIRPHQNLDYFTPARIWDNDRNFTYEDIYYFSKFNNTLNGIYFFKQSDKRGKPK